MEQDLKRKILAFVLLRSTAALIIGAAGGFFISSIISNIHEIGKIISGVCVIIGSSILLIVNFYYKNLFK